MTLFQLLTLDAIVRNGSFKAAAEELGRTHPSLSVSIKNLEEELGFQIFNREHYRVRLTESGEAFYSQSKKLLVEQERLQDFADHLAMGSEAEIDISLTDVCPIDKVLNVLNCFFKKHAQTNLNLHFDAVFGSVEKLVEQRSHFSFVSQSMSKDYFDLIPFFHVRMVPVAAPGYIIEKNLDSISKDQIRKYTQVIVRDTSKSSGEHSYGIVEGAKRWTVPDQVTRKEVILASMGWGRLPHYLVEEDIKNGRLVPIRGESIREGAIDICLARNLDRHLGPVASGFWDYMKTQSEIASVSM